MRAACIAYVICIIYLILQGVGDGSQPLISQCYGERNWGDLKFVRKLAYGFAFVLSAAGCVIMYLTRGSLMFGGQIMIWWSTVFARILSALLALILKRCVDRF